jgi:hypothetical protein
MLFSASSRHTAHIALLAGTERICHLAQHWREIGRLHTWISTQDNRQTPVELASMMNVFVRESTPEAGLENTTLYI